MAKDTNTIKDLKSECMDVGLDRPKPDRVVVWTLLSILETLQSIERNLRK
jgi:hypothetical protein